MPQPPHTATGTPSPTARPRRAVNPNRLREFIQPKFTMCGDGVVSFEASHSQTAVFSDGTSPRPVVSVDRILTAPTTAGSFPSLGPDKSKSGLYQRCNRRADLKVFLDTSRSGVLRDEASVMQSTLAKMATPQVWYERRTDIPDVVKQLAAPPPQEQPQPHAPKKRVMCMPPRVFGGRVVLGDAVAVDEGTTLGDTVGSAALLLPSQRRRVQQEEVMTRNGAQTMHYARTTLGGIERGAKRVVPALSTPASTRASSNSRAHTAPSCKSRDAILGVGVQERVLMPHKRPVAHPLGVLKVADM
eukprot:PhM_4_TR1914/c0_g1_i1/m.98632